MAVSEENSALFPVFILAMLAVPLVSYTLNKLCRVSSKKTKSNQCQCSICFQSEKYSKSVNKRISNFSTFGNLALLLLWFFVAVLVYYARHMNHEVRVFEPFSILELDIGATDTEVKKAFRRLSMQYHPDKNPVPEAHTYFVEHISKAYQALTDQVSRRNFEKFGHPDGRQGIQMGIALPLFMMTAKGSSGGLLLLAIVGIGILLPMTMAVIYLYKSSKYSSNFVLFETLFSYFQLMEPSLSLREIIYVFTKASEYLNLPIRESDNETLEKILTAVKSELKFDPKDMKHKQARFWKQHPSLRKADLLMLSQLTRGSGSLSPALLRDYKRMLERTPRLLDELMKMAISPRPPKGHGWLKPAISVVELSQNIIQAVPLSARKTTGGSNEGIAPFLQLPHFSEAAVVKLAEKNIHTLQDLRDMSEKDRYNLLMQAIGFSSTQSQDIEIVIQTMPSIKLDIVCETSCENEIQEGDIITLLAWVTLERKNGLITALPHAPFYPFPKEENYWLIFADSVSNDIYESTKINFMDEYAAIKFARKATREIKEGCGASFDEVDKAVKEAVEKVKKGSRLVMGMFRGPCEGTYKMTCHFLCDSWIGCDTKLDFILEILKHGEGDVTKVERGSTENEEEEEIDDNDYDSEYSEDEEDEKNEGVSKKND